MCIHIYIYIVYVYTYEYVYVYVYVCVGTQKYGNRSVQLLAVQQTLEAERPQDKNRAATHAEYRGLNSYGRVPGREFRFWGFSYKLY